MVRQAPLDQIPRLLIDLEDRGYRIGVNQHIQTQELLLTLAENGENISDPERLRSYLAPLLATSPIEQLDFPAHFQAWLESEGSETKSPGKDETSPARGPGVIEVLSKKLKRFKRTLIVLFSLLAMGAFALFFAFDLLKEAKKIAISEVVESRVDTRGSTLNIRVRPTVKSRDIAWAQDHEKIKIKFKGGKPEESFDGKWLKVQKNGTTGWAFKNLITEIPRPEPPQTEINLKWYYLLPFTVIIPFVIWLIYRRSINQETQAVFSRRPDRNDEGEDVVINGFWDRVFSASDANWIASHFRRRFVVPSNQINIEPTVESTLKKSGWFSPVYKNRQRAPEYLVLVARDSENDFRTRLHEKVIRELVDRDVHLAIFSYRETPEICFSMDEDEPEPLPLTIIAQKFPGYRLLVFGRPEMLLHPVRRGGAPWTEIAKEWKSRVLFYGTESNPELIRKSVRDSGFAIHPATPEGLVAAVDSFTVGAKIADGGGENTLDLFPSELKIRSSRWVSPNEPEESAIDRLLIQLRNFLGSNGFLWLKACAVYPQLNWGMTLHLGNALPAVERNYDGVNRLLNFEALSRLTMLPWFKSGYFPNWFRDRLIASLDENEDSRIRQTIQRLLISKLDPSYAPYKSDGSPELKLKELPQHVVKPLFRQYFAQLKESESPESNDYVFLEYMNPTRAQNQKFQATSLRERSEPAKLEQSFSEEDRRTGLWPQNEWRGFLFIALIAGLCLFASLAAGWRGDVVTALGSVTFLILLGIDTRVNKNQTRGLFRGLWSALKGEPRDFSPSAFRKDRCFRTLFFATLFCGFATAAFSTEYDFPVWLAPVVAFGLTLPFSEAGSAKRYFGKKFRTVFHSLFTIGSWILVLVAFFFGLSEETGVSLNTSDLSWDMLPQLLRNFLLFLFGGLVISTVRSFEFRRPAYKIIRFVLFEGACLASCMTVASLSFNNDNPWVQYLLTVLGTTAFALLISRSFSSYLFDQSEPVQLPSDSTIDFGIKWILVNCLAHLLPGFWVISWMLPDGTFRNDYIGPFLSIGGFYLIVHKIPSYYQSSYLREYLPNSKNLAIYWGGLVLGIATFLGAFAFFSENLWLRYIVLTFVAMIVMMIHSLAVYLKLTPLVHRKRSFWIGPAIGAISLCALLLQYFSSWIETLTIE